MKKHLSLCTFFSTLIFINIFVLTLSGCYEDAEGLRESINKEREEKSDKSEIEIEAGLKTEIEREPELNGELDSQPEIEEEATPVLEVIFEDELINEETLVDLVNEGDEVIIHLSGVEKRTKFSEHKQVFLSTWTEEKEECKRVSKGDKGIMSGLTTSCKFIKVHKKGDCGAIYRKLSGVEESPIEFDDDRVLIEALINNHSYRFDEIHFYQNRTMSLLLRIRQEMIRDNNELYIRPVNESMEPVRVGFLKYVDCPGHLKEDFFVGNSTFSDWVPDELKREFQVNLEIVRASHP